MNRFLGYIDNITNYPEGLGIIYSNNKTLCFGQFKNGVLDGYGRTILD